MLPSRRRLLTGAGALALALGATAACLAATQAAAGRQPADNPASRDPGYPGNDHGPAFRHDPDEPGPCGVRWGDVYVDDDGLVAVTWADGASGGGCHVMTKAEVDQSRRSQRDHPYGHGAPAPGGP